jgi:GNAT superfamily N-acetyltransferase
MPDGAVVGLRASTPADDAVQATWVSSAEEVERFAGRSLTFPITTEQLQAHRDDPAITALVAFVEPDVAMPVGRLDVVRTGPSEGRLSRVLVDPGRRGQGLARHIVASAIGLAREAGLSTLELHVFTDNAPALRVYERVGFVVAGPAPKDPDRQVTMRLVLA